MERDLTHAALDAIAFVTGATLSAMLGLMQLRVDRAAGRTSGYLLLWVLGFIWTFGNFLRCALELAGAAPDSAGARVRGVVRLELHAARAPSPSDGCCREASVRRAACRAAFWRSRSACRC